MSSQINAFKDALKTRLLTVPGFSGRIFVERQRNYSDAELPCLEIIWDGATPTRAQDHYITWRARFGLEIRVKGKELSLPETLASELASDVLGVLYLDPTLAGEVTDEIEFGALDIDRDNSGEQLVIVVRLALVITYTEELYGPAIDDFMLSDVQIDMASPRNDPQTPTVPDGQIDASTHITLPQ